MSTLKFEGIVTAKTAVFSSERNGVKIDTQKLCVTENSDDKYPINLEIQAMNYDVDNMKFDKLKVLCDINIDDVVEVEYKPTCKVYEGAKGADMFGSNNLWKINVLQKAQNDVSEPEIEPKPVQSDNDLLF